MESATASLAIGSRFEDRYEIEGELGSGSFGRVYRARQLSTGQSVALKIPSVGEGAERFRRELQICATLSHPNIVPLIDCGETGSTPSSATSRARRSSRRWPARGRWRCGSRCA